ncbi:UvrD-like Helicase, ATP-binding domain, P-loop containing nucleoside triphosphate hydrolase [Melia azedarach]|uniref:UvrD-like Helicase, ATP-binding domain, P-loop containing nucleoside triphosphate hydrolase n=1 Tax=Melia azedarach TaxID=155640 RepID=A0ACC1XGD6_MELAZ|nr:UvrD-like Helicase, ATP-binding domain, P-loop containing nucleoside triphosphate hydrolase [Melia azedarach]
MMLDGTLGNSYFERFHDIEKHSDGWTQHLRLVSLQNFIRTKEVTYEKFSSSYWPHFNSQLTKKLDSSRVFTEIISHIKGSLQSMEVGDGKLGREDYVQLSESRASTLRRQKRERIYDIFESYEQMKMRNGEFDLADLVNDIIDLNQNVTRVVEFILFVLMKFKKCVLKLAQSIIDLLYHFFPHSVDIVNPEKSFIFGEPPVLLESGDNENAIIKNFGNNGSVRGKMVGFGAEQVILVRDDCVRKEISGYVGKQALVLTIVESKGLEFQLSKPMFDYWKKKFLIQVRRLDDSLAQAMQVASSPEEWKSQGIKHNCEMATICFERAQDTYWEGRSKATGLKAAADRIHSSNREEANIMLREASKIFEAIGKADLAARSNLLQKAGNFKEASILTLNYVLANSLWSTGNKGWPLKEFRQKEELLEKAKSLAKDDSCQFYEFVCMEDDILSSDHSDLFIMNQQLNSSKRHQSVSGEILSSRKILDVHLRTNSSKYVLEDELVFDLITYSGETICRNRISVQTMNVNDYRSHGDFCLSYHGVWKQYSNLNTVYLLLNSDADWVGELDKRYARGNGKLVSVDVRPLVSAAGSYWSSELLAVGMKVLNNLEDLYKQSSKNSSSVFCQVICLCYLHKVAKFLTSSKFLYHHYHKTKIQRFVELSMEHFFDSVFPLDWRKSLRKNVISLRGTEVYRNAVQDLISWCIGLKDELSYGEIGYVVVMILGSGKLSNDLYKSVAERFDGNTPWKEFVQSLSGNMELKDMSHIKKFHGAMEGSAKPTSGLVADMQQSLAAILEFVVNIVRQFLYNDKEMVAWIINSRSKSKDYHALVVLRLVVIVYLIHLNFGNCENILLDLVGRNYISNKLPRDFYDVLRRRRNPNAIAEAFKKIGNPLVIVNLWETYPNFACPDAVFVDMNGSKCKEEILEMLFPISEASQGHSGAAKLEATNLQGELLSAKSNERGKNSNHSSSNSASPQHQEMNTMNEDVEKSIQLLAAAMDEFSLKNSDDAEARSRMSEAASMLEDLKQLHVALNGLRRNSRVGKVYKKLQSRRPNMEPFLNQLFLEHYKNLKGKAVEIGNTPADSNADKGNEGKMKAVTTPASKGQGQGDSQQTENKGTGKTNSKKNKKNKGSRRNK